MHRLTYASEQHLGKKLEMQDHLKSHFLDTEYRCFFEAGDKGTLCFKIVHENGSLFIDSNYFIGVDWIIKDKASLYIEPKLNDEMGEVDFLSMLIKSLEASENLNKLDGLFKVRYDDNWITIPQRKDFLSPFLIVQFLKLLQHIVKKGLKKSYYSVRSNLRNKLKGKVLVGAQVKENVLRCRLIHTVCEYQEFGFNFPENQFLKTVMMFVKAYVYKSNTYFSAIQKTELINILNYCESAFGSVDEYKNVHADFKINKNVFYRDYLEAIRIGELIIKRFSYNINKVSSTISTTPPFWIDMSKLFELYVFQQLKSLFPAPNAITYHDKFLGGKETDILIRERDYQAVVDCKYKPRYISHNPSLDDKRQLVGYTRLKSVYKKLDKPHDEVVKGVIIYSHQDFSPTLEKANLFDTKIDEYVDFYKLGISLPTTKK
jgi:5-methylcytosine-specific restriction enzyme subunit McrC